MIGNINCQSILEVEGKIEGDINGNIVTIRESGEVVGNIVANILNIKGKFSGNIKSEKVNISEKSEIKASIEYCFLCVEDGAIIEGGLKRIEKSKLEKKPIDLGIKKVDDTIVNHNEDNKKWFRLEKF